MSCVVNALYDDYVGFKYVRLLLMSSMLIETHEPVTCVSFLMREFISSLSVLHLNDHVRELTNLVSINASQWTRNVLTSIERSVV